MNLNEFGMLLRTMRMKCRSADPKKSYMTQAELGELIGRKMGDFGFSHVMVSNWENGRHRISIEQREVLMSIVEIFVEYGGISCPAEAQALLHAGDYRDLDMEARQHIFGTHSNSPIRETPLVVQTSHHHDLDDVIRTSILGDTAASLPEDWEIMVIVLRQIDAEARRLASNL